MNPDDGVLYVTRTGAISTFDERKALADRKADPLVVPGIRVLVDCTDVTPADSSEVVEYLAGNITRSAAALLCGPVAILTGTDVQYGMARMYQSMIDLVHPHTEIFRSREAAVTWLTSQRPPASGEGT